jgi:hypothetical protein
LLHRFYVVSRGKCPVCVGGQNNFEDRVASYFVPVDRTLPWVRGVPYWLNPKKSKKTPAQIDQYWRDANARMEAGEPMSMTRRAAKLVPGHKARKAAKKAASSAVDEEDELEDEDEDMDEPDSLE